MKPIPSPDIEVARLELWVARTTRAYAQAQLKPTRTRLSNLLCDAAQALSKLRASILVSRLTPH